MQTSAVKKRNKKFGHKPQQDQGIQMQDDGIDESPSKMDDGRLSDVHEEVREERSDDLRSSNEERTPIDRRGSLASAQAPISPRWVWSCACTALHQRDD